MPTFATLQFASIFARNWGGELWQFGNKGSSLPLTLQPSRVTHEGAQPNPKTRAKPGKTKEEKKMNIAMGELILVIQSIAIASVAGWVFYGLLTWLA